MPKQPDDFEPTEADIDIILEDVHDKPADKGSVLENIKALVGRIAELETAYEKLGRNGENFDAAPLQQHMDACSKDLNTARERLRYYQDQLRQQN
jgi:hypothetical protein